MIVGSIYGFHQGPPCAKSTYKIKAGLTRKMQAGLSRQIIKISPIFSRQFSRRFCHRFLPLFSRCFSHGLSRQRLRQCSHQIVCRNFCWLFRRFFINFWNKFYKLVLHWGVTTRQTSEVTSRRFLSLWFHFCFRLNLHLIWITLAIITNSLSRHIGIWHRHHRSCSRC